jgi:HEAT repeat protein
VNLVGSIEEETIRLAIKDLGDPDEVIRQSAAKQLGKLRASQAVPSLINVLNDSSWMVRMTAAESLGRIGLPSAASAKAHLESLLSDRHSNVVAQARHALTLLS